MNKIENLNDMSKGILALLAGLIVVLYTLGILEKLLSIVFLLLGLLLMTYGLNKIGILAYVIDTIKRK
jgi:hypothetical protein